MSFNVLAVAGYVRVPCIAPTPDQVPHISASVQMRIFFWTIMIPGDFTGNRIATAVKVYYQRVQFFLIIAYRSVPAIAEED